MNVFNAYSRYYDLLYRDKDYPAEAGYIHRVIQGHLPGACSVLELGCGTCAHAVQLAQEGYTLHGVDQSASMLKQAKSNIDGLTPENAGRISLTRADIRAIRLDDRFEVAISLFHVISYLSTNDDLAAAFETAKYHLTKGGLFLFDCWYGPAVLAQRPELRAKRIEDDKTRIVRIAEPVMRPNENLVEVNYQVFVTDKENGLTEELKESHIMRYLFRPEVEAMLIAAGFRSVDCRAWMSDREPGMHSWNVLFIAKI